MDESAWVQRLEQAVTEAEERNQGGRVRRRIDPQAVESPRAGWSHHRPPSSAPCARQRTKSARRSPASSSGRRAAAPPLVASKRSASSNSGRARRDAADRACRGEDAVHQRDERERRGDVRAASQPAVEVAQRVRVAAVAVAAAVETEFGERVERRVVGPMLAEGVPAIAADPTAARSASRRRQPARRRSRRRSRCPGRSCRERRALEAGRCGTGGRRRCGRATDRAAGR